MFTDSWYFWVAIFRLRSAVNMLQCGIGWILCLARLACLRGQVDAFWCLGRRGVCRDFGESLWSVECPLWFHHNIFHLWHDTNMWYAQQCLNTPRESGWRHFDFSTIVLRLLWIQNNPNIQATPYFGFKTFQGRLSRLAQFSQFE